MKSANLAEDLIVWVHLIIKSKPTVWMILEIPILLPGERIGHTQFACCSPNLGLIRMRFFHDRVCRTRSNSSMPFEENWAVPPRPTSFQPLGDFSAAWLQQS